MAGSDCVRAARAALKLTYDDFVHFPDDGRRHELIDGEHYLTPSPNTRHQRISGTLFGLIWTWLQARPVGQLFHAPYDVVFSDCDVVAPDLVYVSNERAAEVLTPLHAKGVPEIVVEIGSKGRANATRRSNDGCTNLGS
jgi:Uma2 family endonuclease